MPKETETALRAEWGNLEQATLESLLIESYRLGKISVGLIAQTLGIGVVQADQWLADRGVSLNYSRSDLEADRKTLRDLLP
jgi:predicted HTH domain antitoxin